MTKYYKEGTSEAENYDVERKKIGTIGYKKENEILGEQHFET